jgi:hypothetical protein
VQFGSYEWCITPLANPSNPVHQHIIQSIEAAEFRSTGKPLRLRTMSSFRDSLSAAGFHIEYIEDLAMKNDRLPWYHVLNSRLVRVPATAKQANAACSIEASRPMQAQAIGALLEGGTMKVSHQYELGTKFGI